MTFPPGDNGSSQHTWAHNYQRTFRDAAGFYWVVQSPDTVVTDFFARNAQDFLGRPSNQRDESKDVTGPPQVFYSEQDVDGYIDWYNADTKELDDLGCASNAIQLALHADGVYRSDLRGTFPS